MNLNEKKVNDNKLEDLFEKIKTGDDNLTGKYIYKNMRIIIIRKTPYTNSEKSTMYYQNKRAKGICVKCNKKVVKINPITKKLYRCCEYHRKEENEYKRIKRQ